MLLNYTADIQRVLCKRSVLQETEHMGKKAV